MGKGNPLYEKNRLKRNGFRKQGKVREPVVKYITVQIVPAERDCRNNHPYMET
ncbi:hypothetical protein CLOM621_06992 [Clostridium sp. M62/1]|nr:hypothetical protein CLOM621_06992 [Clostridium sp. M62/1]